MEQIPGTRYEGYESDFDDVDDETQAAYDAYKAAGSPDLSNINVGSLKYKGFPIVYPSPIFIDKKKGKKKVDDKPPPVSDILYDRPDDGSLYITSYYSGSTKSMMTTIGPNDYINQQQKRQLLNHGFRYNHHANGYIHRGVVRSPIPGVQPFQYNGEGATQTSATYPKIKAARNILPDGKDDGYTYLSGLSKQLAKGHQYVPGLGYQYGPDETGPSGYEVVPKGAKGQGRSKSQWAMITLKNTIVSTLRSLGVPNVRVQKNVLKYLSDQKREDLLIGLMYNYLGLKKNRISTNKNTGDPVGGTISAYHLQGTIFALNSILPSNKRIGE